MDEVLAYAGRIIPWDEATICDVGGGGGIHAALLACRAKRVHCTDIIDQHARYQGEFARLLLEKLGRYDIALPIERIEFNVADATNLLFRDGWFDFICSINAFEHIPDPRAALREIARAMRAGAMAYISFD
ncbi:MAG TPA: class I SAM-dependent methyltransferase, partial [Casimicrobiaceae bacterium]|nr:class I SAM-dependent methyltransferase [Casimicrobiaceae bacterium]